MDACLLVDRTVYGNRDLPRLNPTGIAGQASEVEAVLASDQNHVWVSEVDGTAIGFVAVELYPEKSLGVIGMLAVDPEYQNRGIGSSLTAHALNWIRESGMHVAMVETGGDPGHAPARRTYEKAGFAASSPVGYWMSL